MRTLDVISTTMGDFWCIRLLVLAFLPAFLDARFTPPSTKPRLARSYSHPDENLPRLNCTDGHRDFYCLNNGSCYMQLDIMSNTEQHYCTCADGYRGRRCENIHDDYVYLPRVEAERIVTIIFIYLALVPLLVIATYIASAVLHLYWGCINYPVEYVYDTASEIGTVDYPFNMRARHDARAFRTRRIESMSIGTTMTSRSSELQTTIDFWPQEGEAGGSRDLSRPIIVHRSNTPTTMAPKFEYKMESTSIGTPMTAQQTTVDFWPQESEADGSCDSSRPHVHRSQASPQIVELGPSSV